MANPDLSAVLQTLSTFSQQQRPPPPTPSTTNTTNTTNTTTTPKPPSSIPSSSSSFSSSHSKPPSNPSLITTWPPALRHIMHNNNNNMHQFTAHIRRLITTQHAFERKWWEEREALVHRQAARGERKRELDRVLKSVGATTSTTAENSAGDDDQTRENAIELAYYDAKVYKAATELSRSTETELRRLGVPFFAIDQSLISADQEDMGEGKISKDELVRLKRRMLELLEDLCRD